jgi:membrane-bound lytic murein transglycosylase MltF
VAARRDPDIGAVSGRRGGPSWRLLSLLPWRARLGLGLLLGPRARSRAGAIGLMQVMPFNAPKLGLTEAELWEPDKNVLAGTRRLGAPLPRNGETPAYVSRVLHHWYAYERQESAVRP